MRNVIQLFETNRILCVSLQSWILFNLSCELYFDVLLDEMSDL